MEKYCTKQHLRFEPQTSNFKQASAQIMRILKICVQKIQKSQIQKSAIISQYTPAAP